MKASTQQALSKVPEVTLGFWIIKIAATTLGETGGDAVSMSMNLGYLVGTGIFARDLPRCGRRPDQGRTFQPLLYWTTIIATTTVGTTLADFADRSLGIGYAGGTTLLLALLLGSLFVWHRTLGSVSVERSVTPKAELSTGSRSCSRRPWAPRWATGPPAPQARLYRRRGRFSAACWR